MTTTKQLNNMNEEVIYIKMPASEPPEQSGSYYCAVKIDYFKKSFYNTKTREWRNCSHLKRNILYWFKPVPALKYANDFADWLTRYYNRWGQHFDGDTHYFLRGEEILFAKRFNTSELQQEFLKTYKG